MPPQICSAILEHRRVVLWGFAMACVVSGLGVVTLVQETQRPSPTGIERRLVGRWFTTHGNVATSFELRADRTATVSQEIRVALPGGRSFAVGPTTTHGQWSVEDGQLVLVTKSPELKTPWWRKVRRFALTQRWPGDGSLHRDWGLEFVATSSFGFVDHGSGERSRATKADAALVADTAPSLEPGPVLIAGSPELAPD